jgi:hypothetical protein
MKKETYKSDSPILEWLVEHGVPREQLAARWVEMNYMFGIPSEITAEELAEVVPASIRDEVELYFAKAAGSVQ